MKKYLFVAVLSALLLPSIASAAEGSAKSGGWANYISTHTSNHTFRSANDLRTFHIGPAVTITTGHTTGQATDMLLFGQLASGLIGVAGFLALRRRSGEARS